MTSHRDRSKQPLVVPNQTVGSCILCRPCLGLPRERINLLSRTIESHRPLFKAHHPEENLLVPGEMSSILRQIVAGPRVKHQETGLDLCYVTSNIIATSVLPTLPPPKTYPALKRPDTQRKSDPAPPRHTPSGPTATRSTASSPISTPSTAPAGPYGSSAPRAPATRTMPSTTGSATTPGPTTTPPRSAWCP